VQIIIKQSGGFAGEVKELLRLDTANVEAPLREKSERLIRDVKFFDLPAVIQGDVGADFTRYEITVSDGDREHTVTFEDDGSEQTAAMRKFRDSLLNSR
jgi:hypothetical protein